MIFKVVKQLSKPAYLAVLHTFGIHCFKAKFCHINEIQIKKHYSVEVSSYSKSMSCLFEEGQRQTHDFLFLCEPSLLFLYDILFKS